MTTQPTPSKAAKPGRIRAWLFRKLFPHESLVLKFQDDTIRDLQEQVKRRAADLQREMSQHTASLKHLEQEVDRLTAVREHAEGEGWRRPEEQLDAEELAAAFDVAADDDQWLALHQLLDLAIQEAIEESSQSPGGGKFTADDRGFASGGVDFLRDFQRTLIEQRAAARVKAAQAEAEEKK